MRGAACTPVAGDANVKQFVFRDATSDQLSEVMKQRPQNVILIIQLQDESQYSAIPIVLTDDMYSTACPIPFGPQAQDES